MDFVTCNNSVPFVYSGNCNQNTILEHFSSFEGMHSDFKIVWILGAPRLLFFPLVLCNFLGRPLTCVKVTVSAHEALRKTAQKSSEHTLEA